MINLLLRFRKQKSCVMKLAFHIYIYFVFFTFKQLLLNNSVFKLNIETKLIVLQTSLFDLNGIVLWHITLYPAILYYFGFEYQNILWDI